MREPIRIRATRWLRTRSPFTNHRTPKIFGLGFNKTGTSSLHEVFRELRIPAVHGPVWRRMNPSVLHSYTAFSDGFPAAWKSLDARYPGSKFILHVRDLEPWITSRIDHILRIPEAERRWHATPESVSGWVRERDRHHLDVLDHFRDRPGDLLVVNLISDADAVARVCRFLGADREMELPHANANPRPTSEAARSMFGDVAGALELTEAERMSDLQCPRLTGRTDVPLRACDLPRFEGSPR